VAGVASERDVVVLHSTADPARLLDLLDARAVAGKQLHVTQGAAFGGNALTLVLSRDNLHDEDHLRRELTQTFGNAATLVDGLRAVSVVGAGINATYANVRKGSAALTKHGIAPQGLATSSFRITWLIPREALHDAVRHLHGAFLEGGMTVQ
jgi:aspartate kinase